MTYLNAKRALTAVLSCGLAVSVSAGQVFAQSPPVNPPAARTVPAWVARSNENTRVLLAVLTRFAPEQAASLGVEGFDEQVLDIRAEVDEQSIEAVNQAIKQLKQRQMAEKDPLVLQDLDILLVAAANNVRGTQLEKQYNVPYFNLSRLVFSSMQSLLDAQIAPARRPAALVRLKRYAGLEAGYTPITVAAEARTRASLNKPGLVYPIRAEVQKDLASSAAFIEGIGQLFATYKIEGYQEAYTRLKEQFTAYDAFVRKEILPRAREDFRQPPELYAFALQQYGVDIPPAQLAARAHAAFDDIQKQMQALAPEVAKAKGYSVTDYRDVIRTLRKEQLVGEAILPHYQKRLAEIEGIIRTQRLVTLPDRPARIRLSTPAESAQSPAPNMRPPRLLGNQGEQGEFVLPLNIPAPPGAPAGQTQKVEDFTYAAASWTLTAHEARPGHELQFASMVEKGVSNARAIYAFNSTNVEGWGLYAEAILLPFMPPEGKLISLQARLQRAARAFLDPELQSGKLTREQALKVLTQEVVLSEPFANQEVERYTFRAPGQATSYFYGFSRLLELRAEVERKLGNRFNQQQFHDFILAQGLLPPDLLKKAVVAQFASANTAAR